MHAADPGGAPRDCLFCASVARKYQAIDTLGHDAGNMSGLVHIHASAQLLLLPQMLSTFMDHDDEVLSARALSSLKILLSTQEFMVFLIRYYQIGRAHV